MIYRARVDKYGDVDYESQLKDRIGGKVAVQCTLNWRKKGGRKIYSSDYLCEYFEQKIPK